MSTPLTAVPAPPVPVGPPALPDPGPQINSPEHANASCGCIGNDNPYLGFVGDAEEEPLFVVRSA
jgi:hypothetical protein